MTPLIYIIPHSFIITLFPILSFAKTHLNHSNVLEYLDFAVFYDCSELQEVCTSKLFKFNKKYSLTRIAQPLVKTWLHITAKTLSYIVSNDRSAFCSSCSCLLIYYTVWGNVNFFAHFTNFEEEQNDETKLRLQEL